MPTNWKVLTGADLFKVLSITLVRRADENIDQDSIDSGLSSSPLRENIEIPYDATLDTRSQELVSEVVDTVRESIQNAGRNPLSVTLGAVPPKAVRHVLNVAAYQLINSSLNLQSVLMGDKGAQSSLYTLYKEGLDYIKSLEDGGAVLPPTDPTGMDYVNPINMNTNPAISAVLSAPMVGTVDLSTDGIEFETPSGTLPPNGNVVGNIGDIYQQTDANGVLIKIWEKLSGDGTFYGWQ